MKILIGITSKNRASILPKSIQSALEQSFLAKDIWVYDDASTDSTKSLQTNYPSLNWITGEEPKGLVWARNFFMKKDEYDYFCSLDDDAWFTDNTAIENALIYMNDNPEVGVLGFDMLSPDLPYKETIDSYFQETNNFIGCGHIVRLTAAKKVGFYTENPGFYGGEEKDLCIRLIEVGYKVITYKGMYVWHDKTILARDLKMQHQSGVCNDLVFTYRRAPANILIPVLIIKLCKHLKFSLTYKDKTLIRPCISGFRDFFKWLFSKNKRRKPVSNATFRKFISLGKS